LEIEYNNTETNLIFLTALNAMSLNKC